MEPDAADLVVPADFPELQLLAWNRDPARAIPAREAFALYERNWRFIDRDALTDAERNLIQALTRRYGHGRLLAG